MANRYWYGLHWPYGVGVRHADDGSLFASPVVFLSKRERDAWVDADRFDGNLPDYNYWPVYYTEADREGRV